MSSSKKPRKIGDPPAKSVFFGQLQMIIAKFQPKIWKVAERVGFEPTVVLPTHAFQACALNHSAISPTVFPPAPNRMVIRQWTLIFHEFAPGASSFGKVMEGGVPRTALPKCDRPRSQRCSNVKVL